MQLLDDTTPAPGPLRAPRGQHPLRGIFRPGVPEDPSRILNMFAIAARVVCQDRSKLDTVGIRLADAMGRAPGEYSYVTAECARLWQVFAKTLTRVEGALAIAGRTFVDDLDALGSKLELMPLPSWEELPEGIDDPKSRSWVARVEKGQGASVELVAERMHKELSTPGLSPLVRAREVSALLSQISPEPRGYLIAQMAQERVLDRQGALLLTRFLAKPHRSVDNDDTAIIEVLDLAGRWLASHPQAGLHAPTPLPMQKTATKK